MDLTYVAIHRDVHYRQAVSSDRRVSERVPVVLRALYRSRDHVVDGIVADLSNTGLFLSADIPATDAAGVDPTGQLEVDLPAHGTVRLAAEVVRLDPSRGGVALRFADVAEARRPLANFIIKQSFWSR